MSTSNIQNYLSNVFRPSYAFDSSTGQFRAVLDMYNINSVNVNSFNIGVFNVGDSFGNAYVGINAGNPADTPQGSSNNVALGIGAANSISNVLDSVFIGYGAGAGAVNSSNIIAIGSGTNASGSDTIYIGSHTGVNPGSNNIFIGHGIAPVAPVDNQLRIGPNTLGQTVINADLLTNRVGILTSNPQYPIDLAGYTYIQDGLAVNGSLSVTSNVGIGVAATPGFALNVNGIGKITPTLIISNGGTTSNSRLLLGPAPSGGNYDYCSMIQSTQDTGLNYGSKLSFWTHSNTSSFTDLSLAILIDSNQRVGINTAIPIVPLHISRNVNFNPSNVPGILSDQAHIVMEQASNSNQRLAIGYNGSNTTGFIQAFTAGSNLNNFVINPNGGNLGIRTTTPTFTLDVSGTARITSNLGVTGTLNVSGISTFTSNVGVRGTLNVSGISTFTSNVDVLGVLRGSSNIVAVQTSSTPITNTWTSYGPPHGPAVNNSLSVVSISYTPKQSGTVNVIVDGRVELAITGGTNTDFYGFAIAQSGVGELTDYQITWDNNYIYSPAYGRSITTPSYTGALRSAPENFASARAITTISAATTFSLVLYEYSDDTIYYRRANLSVTELSTI